jgi:glutamate formiminotransferase
MSNQLVECVPNFSEGRDLSVIKQITDEIEAIDGVKLLDVDPGQATNRTVVTFVGEPAASARSFPSPTSPWRKPSSTRTSSLAAWARTSA